MDYYVHTVAPVKEELGTKPTEEDWQKWVHKWSKISLDEFFRSEIYEDETADKLRPWPEVAIDSFKVFYQRFCTHV